MQDLNFPPYHFRFKNRENKIHIFDPVRKKFIVLQPEEWVRQHVIQFLNQELGYPMSLINVEKELKVNGLSRRYDVVVFNTRGDIEVLVECKQPDVAVDQKVFDQIARYNRVLNGRYLMVTNGLKHIYAQMDYEKEKYVFLKAIPPYMR
ncbi:type I restriction enzyme HsdR N-terminal domain-containing protein [Robertkochia sp. 3YJGBD-33]|uniref:type I restriction enzyme HsdR N-terminal domain-containing protein n=1 Tax=Robertkochia aurantiaca TaxID=2873700 RepID=UPI001CCCC5A3|nr:type I restriction enzyme HsdR N-terminal domain-containing protein [Robertkochia sp. 3YJGBD-33]